MKDDKKCFKYHKLEVLEKASRMANMTYPVISQSCYKILIGKTYWKGVVLPSILYGSSILGFSKSEIKELQTIENKVYRYMLGAPRYAQIVTLRGEVGASSMEARIMEGVIKYLLYVQGQNSNDLLRRITEEKLNNKKDSWTIEVTKYVRNLKLEEKNLAEMTKDEVKKIVKEWDTGKWLEELESKSSLVIYRNFKTEIKGEVKLYDNTEASAIFYRCRSNNLKLNDRNRFTGGDVGCVLCGAEVENIIHFLMWCPEIKEERSKEPALQQPYISDENMVVGNLLFNQENLEPTKKNIYNMWRTRNRKIKERE